MKLGKKKEAEILKVYKSYWDSYLTGNVKSMAALLDANYTQVGSADAEVFYTRQKVLKFLKDTIDQIAGKGKIKNQKIKLEVLSDGVLVHDLFDLYMLAESDWIFYSNFRASTLMKEIRGKWKFIHQHSSVPDIRTGEGENVATEKVAAENLQLKDAIKRRTIELEEKNRELEIEAALERVRARSLAMHKSYELKEVIQVVYDQFVQLKIAVEHTGFIIDYKTRDDMHIWLADQHKVPAQITIPYFDSPHWNSFNEAKTKAKNFFTNQLNFKEKNKFYRSLFKLIPGVSEEIIKYYLSCPGLAISTVLLDNVGLYIENFSGTPYTHEENNTLIRFGKVFEQTYTRFLDLQKAEAQAREAQIEAGLERVRSRSMAMHQTSELQEVIHTVHKELLNLNIAIHGGAFIAINRDIETELRCWGSGGTADTSEEVRLPLYEKPFCTNLINRIKKGPGFFTEEFTQKEKKDFFTFLFKHEPWIDLDVKHKKETLSSPGGYTRSCCVSQHTSVFIINHFGEKFSVVDNDILKRFGKVFEQTYTRFLDLQKAEAQARESEINLAVERVRASALAMFQKGDLHKVNQELMNQVTALDPTGISGVSIWLFDDQDLATCYDLSSPGKMGDPSNFSIKYNPNNFDMLGEPWRIFKEKNRSYFILEYPIERIKRAVEEWEQVDSEMANVLREALVQGKLKHQWNPFGVFANGLLSVDMITAPTDDTKTIVVKMAGAFNLAYQRFLDLQKAEAQAREAQIEAALEKVRSRSLAMHQSDELKEVILTVLKKLQDLGIAMENRATAIFTFEAGSKDYFQWVASPEYNTIISFLTPYIDHPVQNDIWNARQKGTDFYAKSYTVQEKNSLFQYFFELPALKSMPQEEKEKALGFKYYNVAIAFEKNSAITLVSHSGIPLTESESAILKRFAKVFEQTYTRFLDLQKAEAQLREATIEAALERVRSRTMAMHTSEEMKDLVSLVIKQLIGLGFKLDLANFNYHGSPKEWLLWMATPDFTYPELLRIPAIRHPLFNRPLEAYKQGQDFMSDILTAEEFKSAYAHFYQSSKLDQWDDPQRKNYVAKGIGMARSVVFMKSITLTISNYQAIPYSDAQNQILKRFANAFEQAYIRFLDIQKAEAQSRESQIELGLERVRARAMGMQNSNELAELVDTVFKELTKLDFALSWCMINIIDEPSLSNTVWGANPEIGKAPESYHMLFEDYRFHHEMMREWKARNPKWVFVLKETEKEIYDEYLFNQTEFRRVPEAVQNQMRSTKQYVGSFTFSNFGGLQTISEEVLSDSSLEILNRFGKVFDLTYTRFNDLQKAEAQAREAEIQLALERVRARTMAMHNSQDVSATAITLFDEVLKLGLDNSIRCGIGILEGTDLMETWSVNSLSNGEVDLRMGMLDMSIHPLLVKIKNSWKRGNANYTDQLSGKEVLGYYTALNNDKGYPFNADLNLIPEKEFHNSFAFREGIIFAFSTNPMSEEATKVFERFAHVFGQTYRRYLDLKKAEAQAIEAQIEASLERVRGKAMAMHSSEDLAATIGVFYHELETLSITPRRCGVGLIDKENRTAELSTMNTKVGGGTIELTGIMKLFGHPVLKGIYDNWILQKEYHPVLRGNEIKEYYQVTQPQVAFPEYSNDAAHYGYFFFFSEGGVYAWTEKELKEDELKTYRRFTSVLSLTYKRYKDLKDAEAREKDAIRQASLDRVRAEIASMRTVKDLERITPLIWRELTRLDIPFVRCGVFIIDDEQQHIHTFLSTPDGKAIAASHQSFEAATSLSEAISAWRDHKIYVTRWVDKDFQLQADALMQQGAITSREQYLSTLPKEGIYLHFLPFMQGMLYVGNTTALHTDDLNLVHSVADAFSTAYARYEDFNKLELAKQQVDKTLTDLKQTQKQLIQSEKMASLGELTAGIAHEIQNPLNFVNNFSEVSNELIKEIQDERHKTQDKRDEKLEDELLTDISQNLEKILHHGKRADGIVKGMLQHSRSSSGVKEPTNINALADEYLRLAFHGLRAKDKSFNAKFETDFDTSIGNIHVIPQDIGRVILNLITNAFYAVTEKKNASASSAYEPTVSVSTKRISDTVEIRVSDNGNGIPQKILDKIFQPFFTTKPTGQGTGLGLSLSYDIVKAHGGEITVNSKDGEGSEFTMKLPIT